MKIKTIDIAALVILGIWALLCSIGLVPWWSLWLLALSNISLEIRI